MKNFLLPLVCVVLFSSATMGQQKRSNSSFNSGKKKNTFLEQQWLIGIKGGVNVSKINVDKSYSILTPTNYDAASSRKTYEKFKPIGTQIGLEATYYVKGFSVSVQPTYLNYKFTYSNSYTWVDAETPENRLELSYEQEQQVAYLIAPLILKYEFDFNGVIPYVQAGAYTAFLLNGNKSVQISGTDYASGGVNQFESEPVSVGATDLFAKYHYGFIAGAGLYYNIGNVRLNLDVQYKLGQSIINSAENRYQNDRLSGIGDAMDDITADNLAISLGTLFPLRFLSSGFKSFDK